MVHKQKGRWVGVHELLVNVIIINATITRDDPTRKPSKLPTSLISPSRTDYPVPRVFLRGIHGGCYCSRESESKRKILNVQVSPSIILLLCLSPPITSSIELSYAISMRHRYRRVLMLLLLLTLQYFFFIHVYIYCFQIYQ